MRYRCVCNSRWTPSCNRCNKTYRVFSGNMTVLCKSRLSNNWKHKNLLCRSCRMHSSAASKGREDGRFWLIFGIRPVPPQLDIWYVYYSRQLLTFRWEYLGPPMKLLKRVCFKRSIPENSSKQPVFFGVHFSELTKQPAFRSALWGSRFADWREVSSGNAPEKRASHWAAGGEPESLSGVWGVFLSLWGDFCVSFWLLRIVFFFFFLKFLCQRGFLTGDLRFLDWVISFF